MAVTTTESMPTKPGHDSDHQHVPMQDAETTKSSPDYPAMPKAPNEDDQRPQPQETNDDGA